MSDRWARIVVLLMFLIALALVWQTVRRELLYWGAQVSSGSSPPIDSSAMFSEVSVSDLEDLVVIEVILVDGLGHEERPVTLAAGIWRATTEAFGTTINETQIIGTGEKDSRLGWSSDASRPAYFEVGNYPDPDSTLYGREFIIRTNALSDDHPWSVTLERFGRR
ncbi:MAG: hypothetical protein OXF96_02515 [Chloroflexi bacterium]|nr:hypothetical protein [Chloroflexota bacterium]